MSDAERAAAYEREMDDLGRYVTEGILAFWLRFWGFA